MNLLLLTAGAAEMYCGSCLRDNALATQLIARGHQVTLLPLYTPTVTDEPNQSTGRPVLFGGISVYLQQHFSLFRHTPRLLDRLWDAPPVIKSFAARSIQVDPRMLGAMTVSMLKGEGGYQRKEVAKLQDWLRDEPRPDIVNLPNSMLIALAAPIRRVLKCPIVLTLQGDDLFLDGLHEPYKTQAIELIRSQVQDVDLFIAVSEYCREYMAEYLRIPPSRMRTVPLGVNVTDLQPAGSRTTTRPFTIGYFARIAPEKGLHHLVEAYRLLRQERGLPASRLLAAGYLAAEHRPYLDDARRRLETAGLASEFEYLGSPDRAGKIRALHAMDVLAVPADRRECKGLYALEAMACGVPVAAPNHGSFPEMLQRTGGGVLARSEQPEDMADAIEQLWTDAAEREALGRRGADGVRAFFTIEHMADRALGVYGELAPRNQESGIRNQQVSGSQASGISR